MRPRNLLAILFVLTAGLLQVGCGEKAQTTNAKPRATTQANAPAQALPKPAALAVATRLSNSWILASGTALPHRDSTISAEVNGKIVELPVVRGQQVKRGQLLLRLDVDTFRFQTAQAEGGLAAARAATAQLERDFARAEKLKQDDTIALANYERMKTQLDAAKAQQAQAEAGLALAKKMLSCGELRAPYDGTITQITKEVGEMVTLMPPTPLLRLVDTSSLEIQVFLPESEAPFVKLGSTAQVVIESAASEIQGEIVFVSGQIQPGTQTFEVRVRVANQERRIKAGAFARIRLLREWPAKAILVPLTALSHNADGQTVVRVSTAGGTRDVPVRLGPVVDGQALVEGELDGGAMLVPALAATAPAPATSKTN